MKIILTIIILLAITFVLVFLLLAHQSKSGQTPGLINGKLSNCGDRPNCVCSENQDDHKHYISAFSYAQNEADTIQILQEIIRQMDGEVQLVDGAYLAAIFKSGLFGFVDDLEIRLDSANHLIHTRSSSRVGYSDRGVNRKRVETLAQRFKNHADKQLRQ